MTLNNLINLLKKENYKITEQRKIILNILIENISSLLTAEQLLVTSQKENSKIHISTIYRNLDILIAINVLYTSIGNNGITRFKLICKSEHHHHLICNICGKTVVYDDCDIYKYELFAKENNFILTNHNLELHGICNKCAKQKS